MPDKQPTWWPIGHWVNTRRLPPCDFGRDTRLSRHCDHLVWASHKVNGREVHLRERFRGSPHKRRRLLAQRRACVCG